MKETEYLKLIQPDEYDEYNIQDCGVIYEFSRFNKKSTKMTLGDIHIGDKIYMRMNQERIRMIVIYRD